MACTVMSSLAQRALWPTLHCSRMLWDGLSGSPPGRYYLADLGFGIREGIVIPSSGVRYHLQEWKKADKAPETKKELYNLRHTRHRVIVEQVFGQTERQWAILRTGIGPEYSIAIQRDICARKSIHYHHLGSQCSSSESSTSSYFLFALAHSWNTPSDRIWCRVSASTIRRSGHTSRPHSHSGALLQVRQCQHCA